MAVKEIVSDRDPLLRKRSRPVESFDLKLHKLLDDMRDTLQDEDGVGLAAPQVGILRRIFIMDFDGQYFEMINPEIISCEGEVIAMEACLSVKGNSCYVKRPKTVVVEYSDRYGNRKKTQVHDMLARCCCHENDHLNGMLFYDRKYDGAIPADREE